MSLPNNGIRILRQRLFFDHPSPTERIVTSEYTIINDTDSKLDSILLLELPLMIGLEVTDESGKSLPFLPNREIRNIISQLPNQNDPDIQYIKRALEPGEPYLLWLTLPPGDEIESGQLKVIKLKYYDRKDPSRPPRITANPFTIKRYKIQLNKEPTQNYDIFVNITAPSGFEIRHKSSAVEGESPLTQNRGFYKTVFNNLLQLRIPTSSQKITAEITYDILPPPLETRFVGITVVALYVAAAIAFGLSITQTYFVDIADVEPILDTSSASNILNFQLYTTAKGILGRMFEISGGIIAASAAIAGLVKDPLMARMRLLYLGTAALATAAFLIHG